VSRFRAADGRVAQPNEGVVAALGLGDEEVENLCCD
jgi:hypothetical protein